MLLLQVLSRHAVALMSEPRDVIVFNEAHLKRVLARYFVYYHHSRTHRALDNNAPFPRVVAPPGRGRVVAIPQVGGLHHRYTRVA